MHRLALSALLAPALLSAQAAGAAEVPPPEYAAYVAAVRKADAIQDPLQRCLAYPDLPGNTWAPGLAQMRCTAFRTPSKYSLEAIDQLLAQADGAKTLEAHFQDLLEAQFGEPAGRGRIGAALSVFSSVDPEAERVARAWLAASPDSAFAQTALGIALEKRGWDARGTKYVKDTAPEKLEKMTGYFVEAGKAFATAMQANPKLIPACVGLMEIGRQSSDEVQAYATQRCLQADPASYSVVAEMMNAAEPRWGGSEEAMRTVAAYANARVDQNPLLALFAFEHAYYAISRMDDGDDQAIAVLAPAALQVPNAAYLREVGGAYVRKRDYWKALVYLSQALRFMPDYAQESRYRAVALLQLDQAEWARADAERAVALDPKNGQNLRVLGDALRWSEGPVAALPYYKRAMEDSATREDAFNDYCGALIDARRPDDARQCVDDLLAAYPDNPEGWRQRLVVIGYDAPGSKEAMERFLALNDPERWSLHAKYAEMVRKILAEKNGTASPSDAFDARVLRARTLERSPGGRAYVQRLVAQPKNILETAFDTCYAARKPGVPMEFTAVMSAQPDGTLADVAVRPVNAWSSCFAKQLEAHKVPVPPKGAWGDAYPLFYELKMR